MGAMPADQVFWLRSRKPARAMKPRLTTELGIHSSQEARSVEAKVRVTVTERVRPMINHQGHRRRPGQATTRPKHKAARTNPPNILAGFGAPPGLSVPPPRPSLGPPQPRANRPDGGFFIGLRGQPAEAEQRCELSPNPGLAQIGLTGCSGG